MLGEMIFKDGVFASAQFFFNACQRFDQSPAVYKQIKVLEPPWAELVCKVIHQFCSQADFNFFNTVEDQKSKFPVEAVKSDYILKFTMWFENVVYLIGLHGVPIFTKSVIADM